MNIVKIDILIGVELYLSLLSIDKIMYRPNLKDYKMDSYAYCV